MNLSKSNNQTHFYFISLLAIHYLISIIFAGEIIISPHDNLDITPVNNHIISKIYHGDFESLSYFLSGEIKWYNLQKLFYPTNILHYVLDDKLFYFFNDILKKLLAYFSFYLLAKSLHISTFNSALGGILYSTLDYIKVPLGLAIPCLPYILYLLLNKDTLNKKHYFFLFLIGLNSSLIEDIFVFIFLIPLSLLLNNKNKNWNIYLQIFSLILISSILTDIHLIIGTILSDPIHREAWIWSVVQYEGNKTILPFLQVFKEFFTYGGDPKSSLFIFYVPLASLTVSIFILSLFSKQKNVVKN